MEEGDVPAHPLVEILETIGVATEHFTQKDYPLASEIMDRIEEEGILPRELPSPEFFYFIGLCREKCQQSAAAFEAFNKALEIDPDHAAFKEALDRIME